MAFVAAMNTPKTKVGVNGEEVLTEAGVGDSRVSLFTMLNRGLEDSYIESKIASAPAEHLEDYFVMAFQTRDIRGGKGERDLFKSMMQALVHRSPEVSAKLVELIPEYGCWRDLWELYDIPELQSAILDKVRRQWIIDTFAPNKSLLPKWLPREKSKSWPELVRPLADALFPHMPPRVRLAQYRKEVAKRNRALKTSEINMCGKTWAMIEPGHVPGRSLKLHNAAFLNRKLATDGRGKRRVINEDRSTDPDRIECRQHFLNHLEKLKNGEVKAKGTHVVQPHEIVQDILYHSGESEDFLQAQWDSIRSSVAEQGGLGKVVPMCDFSGSMNGLPYQISLALGILISELSHTAFRDHILTFDSTPQWHSFVGVNKLSEKVKKADGFGQGLSTDFYKACMLILERMEAARVPIGEEPEDLIVLTDMGWDAAHKTEQYRWSSSGYSKNTDPWKTQISKIREAFAAASERVWGSTVCGASSGTGWKTPRIIIWNLRAEFKDFHATAEDDGVLMISGWSPNILKALQKDGVSTMTPYAGLRAVLDDERYDPVRKMIRSTV